eukprot:scaffold140814_cov112-Phaeocystis_antarctica.AAC.1
MFRALCRWPPVGVYLWVAPPPHSSAGRPPRTDPSGLPLGCSAHSKRERPCRSDSLREAVAPL